MSNVFAVFVNRLLHMYRVQALPAKGEVSQPRGFSFHFDVFSAAFFFTWLLFLCFLLEADENNLSAILAEGEVSSTHNLRFEILFHHSPHNISIQLTRSPCKESAVILRFFCF